MDLAEVKQVVHSCVCHVNLCVRPSVIYRKVGVSPKVGWRVYNHVHREFCVDSVGLSIAAWASHLHLAGKRLLLHSTPHISSAYVYPLEVCLSTTCVYSLPVCVCVPVHTYVDLPVVVCFVNKDAVCYRPLQTSEV